MPEREQSDCRNDERAALADEARRLADDSADRAEMQAVREEMDALAADWPDDEPARER
jgi:hypothetical protein